MSRTNKENDMFGIVLAGLCAVGLHRIWGARRFGRFAFAGAGRFGPGAHARRGWGRSRGMKRVFRELNTTPRQEDAIRESAKEIFEAWRSGGRSPGSVAGSLSSALKAEAFEPEAFLIAWNAGEDKLFGSALVGSIERLRKALNPEQRQRLSDLLTRRFESRNMY